MKLSTAHRYRTVSLNAGGFRKLAVTKPINDKGKEKKQQVNPALRLPVSVMHYNMMKKNMLISLFLFTTFNIYCQVQPNDMYDAMNQILEINNVNTLSKNAKPLVIKSPSQNEFLKWCISTGNERINSSQIDSLFLMQQITDCQNFKWDKNKLTKKVKLKNKSTHYFTIPLFLNKDKDLIIVFHQEYGGPLAGQGTFELYRKVSNLWKLINISVEWVS